MPEVHACYKCLLQEKEGPLLNKLEHLTLLRKGASVAIKDGVHGDRHFAEALRKLNIHQLSTLCVTNNIVRL